MNNVLSIVQAAAISRAGLYSDRLLAELLALHEEMIEQLTLERLGVVGSAAFLTSMIGQHENTARELRARLRSHEADTGANGEASSPPKPAPIRQNPPFRRSFNAAEHGFAPMPASL